MDRENTTVWHVKTINRYRALIPSLEDWFTRSSVCLCMAVLSLVLALGSRIVAALDKPIWTDELLTVYIASLQDASAISRALSVGVDGQPASWHLLSSLLILPGVDPHLSFRLLSILGYGLAMLGALLFVGRRFGPSLGLAAALLVSISPLGEFAIEARPYIIVVGLLLIAAALWQRVDERRWVPFAFGLTLCLATALHHLAILAVGCFAIAELTFAVAYARRRWTVWLSLLVAAIPFMVNVPALLHFQQMFAEHFWSKPSWSSIVKAYSEILGVSLSNSLLFVIFVGLAALHWRPGTRVESAQRQPALPVHEIALGLSLLSLPVLLVVVAKITGGGFHFRYVLPTAIGVVFLALHVLKLGVSDRNAVWFVLPLFLTSTLLHGALLIRNSVDSSVASVREPASYEKWIGEMEAAAERFGIDSKIPIVVASVHDYLPAHYYLPAASAKRLYYLTDAVLPVRYTNADSGDKMMIALRQAFPHFGGIRDVDEFVQANRKFMVWSRSDYLHAWIPRYLADSGMELQLVHDDGRRTAYVVTVR